MLECGKKYSHQTLLKIWKNKKRYINGTGNRRIDNMIDTNKLEDLIIKTS